MASKPEMSGQIRQANEAKILQAAERVFAQTGFGGATMALIAQIAGLPKANVHYYFGSKAVLYRMVLEGTLRGWLEPADAIAPDADPATALTAYIRAKMQMAAERPDASRVFANELLNGAPVVGAMLHTTLRQLVEAKAAVIDGWIAAGRMAPVDSTHLFFSIWSATQTYADFSVQVQAVLGTNGPLNAQDHARASSHVVALVLRGCGLEEKVPPGQ